MPYKTSCNLNVFLALRSGNAIAFLYCDGRCTAANGGGYAWSSPRPGPGDRSYCPMICPMNESEKTQGMICDAPGCGDPATHCDSETTDFPLFLCTAHAVEHALVNGGSVRTDLPSASGSGISKRGLARSAVEWRNSTAQEGIRVVIRL